MKKYTWELEFDKDLSLKESQALKDFLKENTNLISTMSFITVNEAKINDTDDIEIDLKKLANYKKENIGKNNLLWTINLIDYDNWLERQFFIDEYNDVEYNDEELSPIKTIKITEDDIEFIKYALTELAWNSWDETSSKCYYIKSKL